MCLYREKFTDFVTLRKESYKPLIMSTIPDRVSTLELSKLCIRKALQELEAQRDQDQQTKKKD